MSATDPTAIDVRLTADLTVIRPGDTLLVRLNTPRISQAEAHAIKERLHTQLPDVTVLLLTGVDGIDVYRPTPESTVQCWHTEASSPCDVDACRQPERLAAGDTGTDPATQA
ncbi:hypothetical protein [Streptomyces sp. NBC_00620]|uniref:hypothetical protein n=1 Tax=Streptomyces sp. NBC_00620 TaxID=2903666 RepID=UPI002251371E|nr:hypothetical protein [Streptomyces sp. NBC_00620]MCX4974231.1 hypothetical protein [Streptomyces sp. NBC_00620]